MMLKIMKGMIQEEVVLLKQLKERIKLMYIQKIKLINLKKKINKVLNQRINH
jgi:hypothetical protein